MQLIRGIQNICHQHKNVVLTIGNFDGVHLGHQNIIKELKEIAAPLKSKVCVMLFEPHPRDKLDDRITISRITPLRDKLKLLKKFGVDIVICQPFTKQFSEQSAQSFIKSVLVKKLSILHITVGHDFKFGYARKGDFEKLSYFGRVLGYSVSEAKTVDFQGERVSSTRIRMALKVGNLKLVNALLGRTYQIESKVIKGNGLGRILGFPTANLNLKKNVLALSGVYLSCVYVKGLSLMGLVNLGVRPTLFGAQPSMEVHVLNFNGNLYGERMTVEFLEKIRDEKKFENIRHLKNAIKEDIKFVKLHLLKKFDDRNQVID